MFSLANIADCVRPIFFQTEFEEFLYATHGGTLFLVQLEGRVYGLTCKHVFGDFDHGSLFVPNAKFPKKGSAPAKIAGFHFASAPIGFAVESDLLDLCVIEFDGSVGPGFFGGTAYRIESDSVGTSVPGHPLVIAGVLKEKSQIVPGDISIGYCRLEYMDFGPQSHDITLRVGEAEFPVPGFTQVTGISGSPVFDLAKEVLCGMVVRGSMNGRRSTIRYIDIADVLHFLRGAAGQQKRTYYEKWITVAKKL